MNIKTLPFRHVFFFTYFSISVNTQFILSFTYENYRFVFTWIFITAQRLSCINLLASGLRRNYETSLISADPLCFDLRPVMAAIISCGFERRIITIHVRYEAAENTQLYNITATSISGP